MSRKGYESALHRLDKGKKLIWISEKMVTEYKLNKGILFVYYILTKFAHPVIKNYGPEKRKFLAEISGLSERQVKRYIDWGIKNGFFYKEGKSLRVRTLKQKMGNEAWFAKDHKHWPVKIYRTLTFKKFEESIHYVFLERNEKDQDHMIRVKGHYHDKGPMREQLRMSPWHVKRWKRERARYVEEPYVGEKVFSYRQIAKVWGKSSTSSVSRMLKRLEEMGSIKLGYRWKAMDGYVSKDLLKRYGIYKAHYDPISNKTYYIAGTTILFNYKDNIVDSIVT